MTLLHHQGRLDPGQVYKNAGPLGTVFEGRSSKRCPLENLDGIVGQIRGNAQITGYHQFVVDASDPFEGFLLVNRVPIQPSWGVKGRMEAGFRENLSILDHS
jgi:proline racemase